MPQILILYAHAMPHRSRVNRRMIAAARTLPGVAVQDLYETYPDFEIDVPHEQSLLAAADLVVLQHPLQWYGMPSLQKEWLDRVLEHNWAYGSRGGALAGKDFWLAVTTGGAGQAYSAEGEHGYPFPAFLPPYRQTALLCGMRWLEPLVMHGVRQADEEAIEAHAANYRDRLASYPAWADASAQSASTGD
jgi:glutathione-regulated potassium-efflux system ancillary protein KefF